MQTPTERVAQLITASLLLAGGVCAEPGGVAAPAPDCSLLDGREVVLSSSDLPDIPPFDKKTVELDLRVMPDGSVRDIRVAKSSAFPELDAKAIAAAQKRRCRALPDGSSDEGVPTRVRLDVWRMGKEEYFYYRTPDSTPWSLPRRYHAGDGPIPFDKPYEALTPKQKALVRSAYENLGENDEPPYPKEGLGKALDIVARIQHKALIEGEMVLIVRIDERGDAQSVSVFKTPDPKVSNVVGSALMLLKYKPGICAGKPCAMDYRFDFDFKVR